MKRKISARNNIIRGDLMRMATVALINVVSGLTVCSLSWASAPTILETESTLHLPLTQRLEVVEKQGPGGREALEHVAFNTAESLQNRWRAVTLLGRAYGPAAEDFLEKSLKSSDWFMRNAATIVIRYGSRAWAVRWSRIMLNDSALVVRTAAVESLKALNATTAQDILWEKLYDSQNYHAGESLWIRRHILEALVQFATPDQEAKFAAVLKEKDRSLRPLARQALEKIHAAKKI
jgi:HEAT repeat protein